MTRSPDIWSQKIEGKTDLQIAEMILAGLVGYRKTSLRRSDDLDDLCNLLRALRTPQK